MATVRVRPMPMERFSKAILDHYRERRAPYTTTQPMRCVLRILERDLGVRTTLELERPDIFRRFTDCCTERKFARSTSDERLGTLRTIIRKGHNELGMLSVNPDSPIILDYRKLPKSDRSRPSFDETGLRRYLEYLKDGSDSWEGGRGYALVATIAIGEIKLKEAQRLTRDDVDLKGKALRIAIPRYGTEKRVPISDELAAILAAWLPRVECEWVFPGVEQVGPWHTSGRINGRGPHPFLRTTSQTSGIGHITFEQLYRFRSEQVLTYSLGLDAPTKREPSFKVGEPHENVFVFGVDQGVLPGGQYAVFKTLVKAGTGGVEASKIVTLSGYGRAQKLVKELQARSTEFGELIQRPGRGYIGQKGIYRIRVWFIDER